MSKVIFIAGYYRSGTSGLAGALTKLGLDIRSEAAANEHNPLGFYEIPELISLDVDLLTCLGAEWTDVRALPAGWIDRADVANFTSRLDEILRRRFPNPDTVWAVKHPHLCHLLPIYERAVRLAGHEPHVIHIFRDPAACATSQKLKNGLSRSHALLLWLSYATAAEYNARHLRRSWLTYEALLAHPAEQFRKIEADLEIPLTTMSRNGLDEACAYLKGELNRSTPLPKDGLYTPLNGLVSRVWSAIEAQEHGSDLWDAFRAEAADLAGFLEEISQSRARCLPGFGASIFLAGSPAAAPQKIPLRPAERLDDGAHRRLEILAGEKSVLPTLAIAIVAPAGRAANITETLESLKIQWRQAQTVKVVSVDAVAIEGIEVLRASKEEGGITAALWPELNRLAEAHDYVAVLNAGDKLDPDACMRFAIASENATADMIYCDEVVPREGGAWVRYKPGWDVTRLRQSAYLGDWVWYRGQTLCSLGGFNPFYAGAEEYELQLRLTEGPHHVGRLPEALFTRSTTSRRDDVNPAVFGKKAVEAVTSHLQRIGTPAEVSQRQFLGLFHHNRSVEDPGTSYVMLCDGADVSTLNHWVTSLLSESVLSGPIVLTGAELQPQVETYFTQIIDKADSLEGKIFAVPPLRSRTYAAALRLALEMVETKHVAIIDIRSKPNEANWLSQLRSRLADKRVAVVGAKALAPLNQDPKQLVIQGPIIIGATARMGATHFPDSPGLGGWFLVDQEASAVAPPVILALTANIKACAFSNLIGDAFWADMCTQIRGRGSRIVWTPDVSFAALSATITPDVTTAVRRGSEASRRLAWDDPYHHPALSLRGDLLAPETRQGLIPSFPPDQNSVLFTGSTENAAGIMGAARAFRSNGIIDATWSSEPVSAAEIRRRAPAVWVRVNPEGGTCDFSPAFVALFSSSLKPEAVAAIHQAESIYATSPGLLAQVRKLAAPGQRPQLWRPALTRSIWEKLQIGTGLNTRPRVLWFDEGNTPPWFMDLVNETVNDLSWIVVEKPGSNYSGSIARMKRHSDELGWSHDLAAFAPQILVRPAGNDASVDQYYTLLAAATGAKIIVDQRLDTPSCLKAIRLPNIADQWKQALANAMRDLKQTLETGKKVREAVLSMPSVEDCPAPWTKAGSVAAPGLALRSAAE